MKVRSQSLLRSLAPLVVLAVALAFVPATPALVPSEQTVDLQEKQFFQDDLRIATANVRVDADGMRQRSGDAVVEGFFQDHGSNFIFYMDPRSGVLSSVIGRVPLIPGSGAGNDRTLSDVSAALGRAVIAVDSAVVGELTRQFVVDRADLIGLDPRQLGPTRAVRVNEQLWQVSIPQVVSGISVRHGRLAATISHGNLVLLGAETWGNVELDMQVRITADQATSIGFLYAGGKQLEDKLWKKPALEIIPFAPAEHRDGEAFAGPVGEGYGHRLVWTFGFRRGADVQRWEVLVDAHDGELIAFEDTNHYGTDEQIVGGIYPLTSTEICPSNQTCGTLESGYPMPFADTGQPAPNDVTNSAGLYEYDGGATTTTFHGPYVRVSDNCGTFSESTTEGSLDLGGLNGDHDCTSSGASPGNTPATRSCFYELNKLIELARGWLPGNTWLQSQLPANVNITDTCNAFYDYSSVNFFKSGGGCRNTGEIAAVFDHEWGHGMDDNDAAGSMSSSSEAYADIASIFRLHASCVGFGFWHTYDRGCGMTADGTGYNANESQIDGQLHCDLDCSGVRDADWDKHADHTPDTPENFVCVHCISGSGPCGRQVHCSAAPSRQAAWDLVVRDLAAQPFRYGRNTAFTVGNRLFYQGSGNVGSWHACTCPGTSDGCGATNAYMQWLAVDDDNGDLGDGTPHMTALYAAFSRHAIACESPAPVNSGCAGGPTTAPELSLTVGSHQMGLEWSAVPGALKYRVFRTEGHAGCDLGKALIAEVVGTSYDDAEVANYREYSYVVQAVGASESCFGPVSGCQTATPLPCAGSVGLDRGVYNCSDTLSISLVDSDLLGAGSHQLEVRSTTEMMPETVTVVESPADSGHFVGSLSTTGTPPVSGDGMLSVTDGGTISVEYLDLSYCGTPNVPVQRTVPVDCAAPEIYNVQASNVTGSAADITWQTDEIADSLVVYDLASPPVAGSAADPVAVTDHLVHLTGLDECSDYFYYVSSTDPAANQSSNDNAGGFYTFETGRNVNPTYPTADPPVSIPDSDPAGAESTIAVTDDNVIEDVDVTVNITHTYDGDLLLSLIGPDGTEVVLSNRRGGGGNDFTETVFDDEAATPIADGSAPFTGSFRPDASLTAFDGLVPAGTWRLRVEDQAGADVGTIDSWSITLTYPAQACGPHLKYQSHTLDDDCAGMGMGGGNGIVEPGEDIGLSIMVRNDGTDATTGVTAQLTTTTPGVTVTQNAGTYPDLLPGETAESLTAPYSISVNTGVACGSVIDLRLETGCSEGRWSDSFSIAVGAPASGTQTFDSADVPQPIDDNVTITSEIQIDDTAAVTDVDVGLTATHTYDGDLDIFLIGPDGTRVELSTDNGSTGENFTDTVFDDEASTPISSGSAPFTGSFQPEGLLSDLDGISAAGTWTLEITDDAGSDTGELLAWSLILTVESDPICNLCMISAPGRVRGLEWMPGSTAGLEWVPTAGATFYNVYRGLGPDLVYLLDDQVDSCRTATTTVATTGETLSDAPPPGSMFWYLVRAATAGGEGSAGNTTFGSRIQNSGGDCP